MISSKVGDEVDLDVVPLDICVIVLGSPYLYDKKVVFFLHENNIILPKMRWNTLLELIVPKSVPIL